MKNAAYLRILAVSLIAALLLSAFSLICLTRLSELGADRHRQDFLLFLAMATERALNDMSLDDLKSEKGKAQLREQLPLRPPGPPPRGERPPPPPDFAGPLGGPPPDGGHRPPFDGLRGPGHAHVWLVNENHQILFSNIPGELPAEPSELTWPKAVHEVSAKQDLLRLTQGVYVVRLNHEPPLFLVSRDERPLFFGPLFVTQAVLTFTLVAMALFLSLSITFFYLRRKSREASAVLLRLERGDLKARFTIQSFDEFGGLLLDFNRMAGEIERLVSRIHATESTRKNLLQELGHDLRTPLTSLSTSFETLEVHYNDLKPAQREELFGMIGAEIVYFKDLLEKLMTIAALDEPHYKQSAKSMDLAELLQLEVKSRQAADPKLDWVFAGPARAFLVLGDPHLILRLVKNAFDNAARFAVAKVEVSLKVNGAHVELRIEDDGPGLDAAALKGYGKRREQRSVVSATGLGFSLGLGSVIMKTIVELHSGQIDIANRAGQTGAVVTVTFPLSPQSPVR